jgi:hypothetical protein
MRRLTSDRLWQSHGIPSNKIPGVIHHMLESLLVGHYGEFIHLRTSWYSWATPASGDNFFKGVYVSSMGQCRRGSDRVVQRSRVALCAAQLILIELLRHVLLSESPWPRLFSSWPRLSWPCPHISLSVTSSFVHPIPTSPGAVTSALQFINSNCPQWRGWPFLQVTRTVPELNVWNTSEHVQSIVAHRRFARQRCVLRFFFHLLLPIFVDDHFFKSVYYLLDNTYTDLSSFSSLKHASILTTRLPNNSQSHGLDSHAPHHRFGSRPRWHAFSSEQLGNIFISFSYLSRIVYRSTLVSIKCIAWHHWFVQL